MVDDKPIAKMGKGSSVFGSCTLETRKKKMVDIYLAGRPCFYTWHPGLLGFAVSFQAGPIVHTVVKYTLCDAPYSAGAVSTGVCVSLQVSTLCAKSTNVGMGPGPHQDKEEGEGWGALCCNGECNDAVRHFRDVPKRTSVVCACFGTPWYGARWLYSWIGHSWLLKERGDAQRAVVICIVDMHC